MSCKARRVALLLGWMFISVGLLGFIGCAKVPKPPKVETESQILSDSRSETFGSLWENNSRAFMFEDRRAGRVGDIVVVQIVEQHSGSKTANTTADREANLSAGVSGGLFGINTLAEKFAQYFDVNAETSNDFEGEGSTSRADSLTGTIAAKVVEVLPNGDLRIQGKRQVKVNSETQTMTIKGIVRRIDLDTQNTVLSSAVADANITYTGLGVVDDVQTPGWATRIFNWLTPF